MEKSCFLKCYNNSFFGFGYGGLQGNTEAEVRLDSSICNKEESIEETY
jgi:hypothetical protein